MGSVRAREGGAFGVRVVICRRVRFVCGERVCTVCAGVMRSWAVLVVRSSVLRPQRAENWGLVEVENCLVGHRSLAAVGRVLMVEERAVVTTTG